MAVEDGIDVILEVGITFEAGNVLHAAGGKIIDDGDARARGEQTLREMRDDEAASASDQCPHESALLEGTTLDYRRVLPDQSSISHLILCLRRYVGSTPCELLARR